MSSRALGDNLYSADFVGMFRSHFLFELTAIERSWLSAFLALDQCGADCFKVSLARLIPADQVADIFAVIGELSSSDLRLDPVVLLICKRDRFFVSYP